MVILELLLPKNRDASLGTLNILLVGLVFGEYNERVQELFFAHQWIIEDVHIRCTGELTCYEKWVHLSYFET